MQIFPDLLLGEERESTPSQSKMRGTVCKDRHFGAIFTPAKGLPGNSRYFDKAGQCSGLVGQSMIPMVDGVCRNITAGRVYSDEVSRDAERNRAFS